MDKVHVLKGSSMNMGANELVAICRDIEEKIRSNDTSTISTLINHLEVQQSRTLLLIDDMLKRYKDSALEL
jgi:HPt (histidine-containing phosphotransfer) domain-containing protein